MSPRNWIFILWAGGFILGGSGCLNITMDVSVAPDMSSRARLAIAVDSSLAEMGKESGGLQQIPKPPTPNWTVREYKEGNWAVTEIVGQAKPGEALFPEESDSPKLEMQVVPHRLSTFYHLKLIMPPPPAKENPLFGEKPQDTMGAPEQLVMSSLASTLQLQLSLQGPGFVRASSGEAAANGQAVWKLNLMDLQPKKSLPEFRLTTELPNWRHIGHLADQLVMRGAPPNVGSRLLEALQRQLLPNPPLNVSAAEKLSAIDYLRLLDIIQKLDAAASPAFTEAFFAQLCLNDTETTSAQIAQIHAKVMALDVRQLIARASLQGLIAAVR